MRILVVQDSDWIRRNPIQHNHLAERLVLRGHEVRVIDYDIMWHSQKTHQLFPPRQVFQVSRMLQNANHTVIRPSIVRLPLLDYASMLFTYPREINRQINEFKPDIIYLDTILSAYLALRIAQQKKIKTIYYCIDICYRLIPFRFLQSIGKLIESYNMRFADRVCSINHKLREYTINMGAKPEKTSVVEAGVDCSKFESKLDGQEIRNKYGFKNTDKILFFVGWLYHFSGLKEVARQISQIRDPNLKLFIVGDGDAYEELQKLKDTLNLGSRMIMAGKQPYDALPQYIAAADICLLPAYNNEVMRDIVPIKLYEYMAMSKPVITTRLPGIMAEFGENNGIVYVDKPEDSVSKAVEILNNGENIEIGAKARNFVEHRSWDDVTDEFEKILLEVK